MEKLALESKNTLAKIKKHMTTSKEIPIKTTRIKDTRAKELLELRVTASKVNPIRPKNTSNNKKRLEKLMTRRAKVKKTSPQKREPRPSDFKKSFPPSTKV